MAVQDVWLPGRLDEELEGGLAEEIKADPVVVPPIHRRRVEEAVPGLDEEHPQVLDDGRRHDDPRPSPVELGLELHLALEDGRVVEELVLGQDDLHQVALLGDGSAQRGDDVAEAADLCDGGHLDGHVDNVEGGLGLLGALGGGGGRKFGERKFEGVRGRL